VNQIDYYLSGERLVGLTLQSSGGTRGAVEAARREISSSWTGRRRKRRAKRRLRSWCWD